MTTHQYDKPTVEAIQKAINDLDALTFSKGIAQDVIDTFLPVPSYENPSQETQDSTLIFAPDSPEIEDTVCS